MAIDSGGNYICTLPDEVRGRGTGAPGGLSNIVIGDFSGGTPAPARTPAAPTIFFDSSNDALWIYNPETNSYTSIAGGGSGVPQVLGGAFDDPTGHLTPSDPTKYAVYLKDQAVPPVVWGWSVNNQNWFNILS